MIGLHTCKFNNEERTYRINDEQTVKFVAIFKLFYIKKTYSHRAMHYSA